MQADTGGVQSIDRAAAILSAFSVAHPVVGVSELARATGLTRSTTHRLLTALAAHGLIAQLPRQGAYCLGPRLLALADIARAQLNLDVQAEPVMTELRNETGETVGLHVLDNMPSRRTIAQVESMQPLRRTYTDLGAPIPPHQGAPGKVLLAHAAEDLRRRALEAGTEGIDAASLGDELSDVRRRGYALSLEERVPGVVALAVPVRDHTAAVVAALSVSIPSVRAGRQELVSLVPAAQRAAAQLSAQLGHVPAAAPVSAEPAPVDG